MIDKGAETLDRTDRTLAKLAECLRPLQQEEVYETVLAVQSHVVNVDSSAGQLGETPSPEVVSSLRMMLMSRCSD